MDQIAREGVDGDHPLGFQLAERDMQRPLIGAGNVETVEGEIDGFADAHAGVTEQQEEVGPQIVAAVQFLLEQLIVFRRQGAREAAGTREYLAGGVTGLTRAIARSKLTPRERRGGR